MDPIDTMDPLFGPANTFVPDVYWNLDDPNQQNAAELFTPAGQIANPPANETLFINNEALIASQLPKRTSRAEWEKHRKVVETQYPTMTLTELRVFMSANHNFSASEQQWKKKLSEWHLSKNLKPRITRFIKKRAFNRRHQENKKTQFVLEGNPIPMDKIDRHLKNTLSNPSSATGETPTCLSYHTYQSRAQVPSQPIPQGITSNRTDMESYGPKPSTAVPSEAVPQSVAAPSAGVPSGTPWNVDNVGHFKMAFWQCRDADQLLSTARSAASLVQNKDYMRAKPLFMEALDGLAALLTPYHPHTIRVLEQFVTAAGKSDDTELAIDYLHKSYNAHQESLGANDKRTWRSLARLGNLYKRMKRYSQAYHMLFNARQGLLSISKVLGPENTYIYTKDISSSIIDVLTDQDDFEAAEAESLNLISQAEQLGDTYRGEVARFKHDLAHLYTNDEWVARAEQLGLPSPPRQSLEKLLLDLTRRDVLSLEREGTHICCWDLLRNFYHSTGQREKLTALLPRIGDFLAALAPGTGESFGKLLRLRKGVASSYSTLRKYDEAEWWLLYAHGEVDASRENGPHSFEALSILMQLGKLYLQQNKVEEAEGVFKKAESLGKSLLPPSHVFHDHIRFAITHGRLEPSCCSTCLVNERDRSDREQGFSVAISMGWDDDDLSGQSHGGETSADVAYGDIGFGNLGNVDVDVAGGPDNVGSADTGCGDFNSEEESGRRTE